jgi:uncharacterized protein YqgC (DUF456 family)
MTETVVAGVLMAIGVIGILLPVLPGLTLILAGIAVWAVPRNDLLGWTVLLIALAVVVVGSVVKYLLPGKRMRDSGVPTRSIVAGAGLGILGFFLIPVIGLFIGFPLGVFLAELARLGNREQAWPSTRSALAAVGLSILVELAAGLLAIGVWLAALIFFA